MPSLTAAHTPVTRSILNSRKAFSSFVLLHNLNLSNQIKMRAVTALIAGFAALAALAAATPIASRQSDYGYWDVNVTQDSAANGYKAQTVDAKYSNTNTTVHCSYTILPWETPAETSSCDDASFSYSLGSDTIALTQTVTLRGEQVTISGNGELVRTCGGNGRYCMGSNRINVSTAVA